MTPEQRAATEMREKAALIFEEEVEMYNEGMSAIDVRLSYTRNLKWPNGRKAAAAIRALPLPEPQHDPRDAALAKAKEALKEVYIRAGSHGQHNMICDVAQRALTAIESALKDNVP